MAVHHAPSKAAETSSEIMAPYCHELRTICILSTILSMASIVERLGVKPYCLCDRRFREFKLYITRWIISFSRTLPGTDRRLIGRHDLGLRRSVAEGFGMAFTTEDLNQVGKH